MTEILKSQALIKYSSQDVEQAVISRSLDSKGEAWARDQHIGEIKRPEIRRTPGRGERLQTVGVGNEEQLTKEAEKEPRKQRKPQERAFL